MTTQRYKYFVRIKPGDPSVALDQMKKAWAGVVAELPFKYEFLDESLDHFYKSESRWSNIVGWAGEPFRSSSPALAYSALPPSLRSTAPKRSV
jgi:hypothetical protein